jgi:23S rRNA maturation-related 3'-5' exoribonuclease YhaM
MHPYNTIDDLIQLIVEPNRTAIARLLADNRDLFTKVQGSTHNHQAWPGGYLDHITEVMNIAVILYRKLNALRPLPFALSDILIVVFLHDVEKPWKYELGEDGQLRHKATMMTKADHQRFRLAKLAEYGIVLNEDHENGLKYAEGELEDYSSRERKMRPLAALAHLCDVTSARIWFDHPASTDDPWVGARRSGAS